MGMLINPSRERRVRDTGSAEAFGREMARRGRKTGSVPTVEVWIQVRGQKMDLEDARRRIAAGIMSARREDVPRDQVFAFLGVEVGDSGDNAWHDVDRYWRGPFRRDLLRLPSREELEYQATRHGAQEARSVVRTKT